MSVWDGIGTSCVATVKNEPTHTRRDTVHTRSFFYAEHTVTQDARIRITQKVLTGQMFFR